MFEIKGLSDPVKAVSTTILGLYCSEETSISRLTEY